MQKTDKDIVTHSKPFTNNPKSRKGVSHLLFIGGWYIFHDSKKEIIHTAVSTKTSLQHPSVCNISTKRHVVHKEMQTLVVQLTKHVTLHFVFWYLTYLNFPKGNQERFSISPSKLWISLNLSFPHSLSALLIWPFCHLRINEHTEAKLSVCCQKPAEMSHLSHTGEYFPH